MDSRKIKGWLVSNGIKQRDVAERTGLNLQYVSNILNGSKTGSVRFWKSFVSEFKVPSDVVDLSEFADNKGVDFSAIRSSLSDLFDLEKETAKRIRDSLESGKMKLPADADEFVALMAASWRTGVRDCILEFDRVTK